ncbi:MAG: DUF21 domain-containing protein [Planctomycetota bacterium]|nr:DUF21 domain-containing protein [Planctomycetota bacterium]
MNDTVSWIAIVFCVTQSAMFSGLNLAVFGISRLRLEAEQAMGSGAAARVLQLRVESNAFLATILWGNVAINVLLTMLADSVLVGAAAFLFSTFAITIFGEIMPQSYFSRHALRMAARFAPVLRFYRLLLSPVTIPTAFILDRWLGPESAIYWPERSFRELIRRHVHAEESDLCQVEGMGALNFLSLDDLPVHALGESVQDDSVITLPHEDGRPVFPAYEPTPEDPFLQRVQASGRRWVILADTDGRPQWVLDASGFLRDALFASEPLDPMNECHRPIVVEDAELLLGEILARFEVRPEHPRDYVIDDDVILVWAEERRVITGADLLGRLLHGVVVRAPWTPAVVG